VGMKTTDTALLGHVSSEALSAAALSDLYTSCTGVLIQGRVLGIFVGQAVGAKNFYLAGIYLQVSLVVLSILSIIVIVSWLFTSNVWKFWGEPEYLYEDAGSYATILSTAIPGMMISSQLSQFFSAQRIMHPEVNSSIMALSANLILGLIFVFGIGINDFDGYGFKACPTVTAAVVYARLFMMWFVYCHCQGLHLKCWNGWSWKEITKDRVKNYVLLYFPAALSISSDFWRMSFVGGVAANLGEDEVAVFNVSYRIFWLSLIFSGSISAATGIKMGLSFGTGHVKGAKRAASVGLMVAILSLLFVASMVASNIAFIGKLFTDDEHLLVIFEEIKWPFTFSLFFMNLATVIESVPMSMGRSGDVMKIGFISSWLVQVPSVVLLTTFWRKDLIGLYYGVFIGYFFLSVSYYYMTYMSDFQYYADRALERAESK